MTRVFSPAAAAGGVLAGTTTAIGAVLDRVKPLHPDGELFDATVSVVGAALPGTGVPWIDVAAEHAAVVRVSRAVGLPQNLPDIAGLALRLDLDAGPADLLFASTGSGPVTRFLLAPRRPGHTGALTSLLPYRSPSGPLLVRARPSGERTYELSWARPTGSWRAFALLHLGARNGDPTVSFDPVLNTVPRLDQYGWVRRLREPAYRSARGRR